MRTIFYPVLCITSLEPCVLTDEDSGDDEEGSSFDNFSGSQLAATVELVFLNKTCIGGLLNAHAVVDKDNAYKNTDTVTSI